MKQKPLTPAQVYLLLCASKTSHGCVYTQREISDEVATTGANRARRPLVGLGAIHQTLTGLANRGLFKSRGNHLFEITDEGREALNDCGPQIMEMEQAAVERQRKIERELELERAEQDAEFERNPPPPRPEYVPPPRSPPPAWRVDKVADVLRDTDTGNYNEEQIRALATEILEALR